MRGARVSVERRGKTTPARALLLVVATLWAARPADVRAADATRPGRSAPVDEAGAFDFVARLLSSRVRGIDARSRAIAQELSSLPKPSAEPHTVELGFHSQVFRSEDEPSAVVVDLGAPTRIDAVALVPAKASPAEEAGAAVEGYGFPVRFRIDLSDDSTFGRHETAVDRSAADQPNPGLYPCAFTIGGKRARYVRVTALKHYLRQSQPRRWVFALGELVVLSGTRDVALNRPVTATPESIEAPPRWTRANLVDGRTLLGLPVGAEPSPSNGFHSADDATRPDVVRWVEVDLGRALPLDEIRLVPARPSDWADIGGYGFPVRFRIELAAEDRSYVPLVERTAADFPNPGDNAVVVDAGGRVARFVRVTATKLWQRLQANGFQTFVFSLSEIEVDSAGVNVARGASVDASDWIENPLYPRWARRFVVDGYSSTHRLMDLPHWLAALDLRRRLTAEQALLRQQRHDAAIEVRRRSTWIGGSLAVGLGVLIAAGLVHQSIASRRALERMRQRIANDLHDDLGSSFGSIALLSQFAQRSAGSDEVRKDLAEINQIALDAAESMRDIVWLMSPDRATAGDLATKIRDVASALLPDRAVTVEADQAAAARHLDLETKRQLFLAAKEILNNVSKHAAASNVTIALRIDGESCELRVTDDGRGFDPEAAASGTGLRSLRERAQRLHGHLQIASSPGSGACVSLLVPSPRARGGLG